MDAGDDKPGTVDEDASYNHSFVAMETNRSISAGHAVPVSQRRMPQS